MIPLALISWLLALPGPQELCRWLSSLRVNFQHFLCVVKPNMSSWEATRSWSSSILKILNLFTLRDATDPVFKVIGLKNHTPREPSTCEPKSQDFFFFMSQPPTNPEPQNYKKTPRAQESAIPYRKTQRLIPWTQKPNRQCKTSTCIRQQLEGHICFDHFQVFLIKRCNLGDILEQFWWYFVGWGHPMVPKQPQSSQDETLGPLGAHFWGSWGSFLRSLGSTWGHSGST